MEKFNGLGVILENRYYGESYPYNTSSTDELRFLTTEQSESVPTHYRTLALTEYSDRRQCVFQATRRVSWCEWQSLRFGRPMDHVRWLFSWCTHCFYDENI